MMFVTLTISAETGMGIDEKVDDNNKNTDKFFELYERYEKRLYFYARKLTRDDGHAEDVIQSAFLNVLKNIDKIDCIESKRTKSYLYTIVNHISLNVIKENKKYVYSCENETEQTNSPASGIQTNDHIFENIIYEDLLHEIRQLPWEYSDILILSGVCEFTIKEISEILDMTEAAVRQRISRGRKKLKERLNAI